MGYFKVVVNPSEKTLIFRINFTEYHPKNNGLQGPEISP
jgi:hypothetical protein